MNKGHKLQLGRWLLPILATFGFLSVANATNQADDALSTSAPDNVTASSTEHQDTAQPKFEVLRDKLNLINDALTGRHPVHYYGFVAQRGQDVLLKIPSAYPPNEPWKVEFYEKGEWNVQNSDIKVFSKLEPGAEIIVQVTPRSSLTQPNMPYSINFGSYPVLQDYNLHDEPGVIRIPSGRTEPAFLQTQVYKEALLDIKFTDTKGTPLEGGTAVLGLKHPEDQSSIRVVLVSDAGGVASRKIELGRCYGGFEAPEFVHRQRGFNTWKSHYKVGQYFVYNWSTTNAIQSPRWLYIGHICSQQVMQTVRPRT
jgi:hypothetical protein